MKCFKTCDNADYCAHLRRCCRIGANETVESAKSDQAMLKLGDQQYGWIWLDDDGWEHSWNEQHPQHRGEAMYGTNFRPATKDEAESDDFFRVQEIHYSFRIVS